MIPFSFAANHATVGDDLPGIVLKISSAECEMNIWLLVADLDLLKAVPTTPWENGALKFGKSANADVWWSCDDGDVFIAAGSDDQTWDFGLSIQAAQFAELRAAIDEELATHPP